jgi:alkylhydroperoxidase family enzyme
MPRIEPIPVREWPEEMRGAMEALRPPNPRHPFPVLDDTRPRGRNALGTLAQHPALARAFHTFNGHVLYASTISVRQRELLVLRVAARRSAQYEWRQHEVIGICDAGLTQDEIDRVADGPDAPEWSPLDRALLRAVDELIGDGVVTDATWATLAAELDTEQLMDVVFTIGAYEILAFAFRSFGVELDDDLERK